MQNQPIIMTENPWTEIAENKRILDIDFDEIVRYNLRRTDNPICLDDFPEPFLGNKNAKVYLLLGNPGFDPNRGVHDYSEDQKNSVLKNLKHENDNQDYPHYLLSPLFENHPGYGWWHDVFQPLLKELETDKATLAKVFFCIELIGYHSEKGDDKIIKDLPSVAYSRHLILNAIRDMNTIIIGRGVTKWLNIVPKLAEYESCTFLASNRGVSLSRSTISPKAYSEVKNLVALQMKEAREKQTLINGQNEH
jgi:hypothetical protein